MNMGELSVVTLVVLVVALTWESVTGWRLRSSQKPRGVRPMQEEEP